MKLLSIAVPCYNSEAYMRNCIESLLKGGEDVEILIVDDGSTKDRTAEIADEYEAQYPTIIKAIHKENGGHGSAVNTGIANATGLYFKVVDSDDWVKEDAYMKILDTLRELAGGDKVLDMLISNYVYEKEGEKRKKIIHYHHILPQDQMFTWNDCHHFLKGHYILMHSVIFRTKLLRDCGVKLPEHTFYVDNIYVFEPLPYVKNMYYLDVNFYRYYIGRQDQSVNESIMISRIDQQIGNDEEQETLSVHAQLSGDYHHHFFCAPDPLRYRGESGEEERALGVLKVQGQRSLPLDAPWTFGRNDESAGQGRQKDFCAGICHRTESIQIQLM